MILVSQRFSAVDSWWSEEGLAARLPNLAKKSFGTAGSEGDFRPTWLHAALHVELPGSPSCKPLMMFLAVPGASYGQTAKTRLL
jgi:hypothetical protein